MSESRTTFFKQSGWMVIATTLSGVFLVAVYSIVGKLPTEEVGIYASLLRVFSVLGIATTGLQIVMAQDAAGAVTEKARADLSATTKSVAAGIALLWLIVAVVFALFQDRIATDLQITNKLALWVTMMTCLRVFASMKRLTSSSNTDFGSRFSSG